MHSYARRTKKIMEMRFSEIDFFRGCAVILMVIYHFFYDMNFFAGGNYDISSGILWLIGRAAAVLFVSIAGVSMSLSYSRNHDFMKFLDRGAKILAVAGGITLITWLFFPDKFIVFGVLHMIGVSSILAYPLLKRMKLNVVLGAFIFISGIIMWPHFTDVQWLLWLVPHAFNTFDYFPLFPWFGIMLLGIAAGNYIYRDRRLRFRSRITLIEALGRHSLLIYLVHQPLLLGLIYLLYL